MPVNRTRKEGEGNDPYNPCKGTRGGDEKRGRKAEKIGGGEDIWSGEIKFLLLPSSFFSENFLGLEEYVQGPFPFSFFPFGKSSSAEPRLLRLFPARNEHFASFLSGWRRGKVGEGEGRIKNPADRQSG